MLTMLPPFSPMDAAKASRQHIKVPFKLRSMTLRQPLVEIADAGEGNCPPPLKLKKANWGWLDFLGWPEFLKRQISWHPLVYQMIQATKSLNSEFKQSLDLGFFSNVAKKIMPGEKHIPTRIVISLCQN